MIRAVLLCVLNAFATCLFANDGAFYANGANIYPTKESSVQMKKEVLTITRKGDAVHVDVQFTFFNPESQPKQVLTAFVSPMQGGDVDYKAVYITNFSVVMNDSVLKYSMKKHYDDSSQIGEDGQTGEYRFYFTANFKPGNNAIHHSYDVRASGSVEIPFDFAYTLITARSWATGMIEDFELNIVSTEPEMVCVNKNLIKENSWAILGSGKAYKKGFTLEYDSSHPYLTWFVQHGSLQLKKKNFKPVQNLNILWFPVLSRTMSSGKLFPEISELRGKLDEATARAEDLRILRNCVYAKYGYVFNDKKLQDYFNKCAWYVPDSTVNARIQQLLTAEDTALIKEVSDYEKKLNGK